MPKTINLMPREQAPKQSTVKIVKTLRTIDLVGSVAFFIGVLAIVSIFLINSEELRQSNSRQNALKTSIQTMQKEEQQYVLLKDRSDKIQKIVSSVGAIHEVEIFDNLKSQMPPDAVISTVSIKKGTTETGLSISSYSSLARALAILASTNLYKGVVLSGFTFSPEAGYLLALKLTS